MHSFLVHHRVCCVVRCINAIQKNCLLPLACKWRVSNVYWIDCLCSFPTIVYFSPFVCRMFLISKQISTHRANTLSSYLSGNVSVTAYFDDDGSVRGVKGVTILWAWMSSAVIDQNSTLMLDDIIKLSLINDRQSKSPNMNRKFCKSEQTCGPFWCIEFARHLPGSHRK